MTLTQICWDWQSCQRSQPGCLVCVVKNNLSSFLSWLLNSCVSNRWVIFMLLYEFQNDFFQSALLPWLLSAMSPHIVPADSRTPNLSPSGATTCVLTYWVSRLRWLTNEMKNRELHHSFLFCLFLFPRGFLCFSCLRGQVQQNDRTENTEPH